MALLRKINNEHVHNSIFLTVVDLPLVYVAERQSPRIRSYRLIGDLPDGANVTDGHLKYQSGVLSGAFVLEGVRSYVFAVSTINPGAVQVSGPISGCVTNVFLRSDMMQLCDEPSSGIQVPLLARSIDMPIVLTRMTKGDDDQPVLITEAGTLSAVANGLPWSGEEGAQNAKLCEGEVYASYVGK